MKSRSFEIHKQTGAKLPVYVTQKGNAPIFDGRRFYTLSMLMNKWNKSRDEVLAILDKYKIPGHIIGMLPTSSSGEETMADKAAFFEEYIKAIERKLSLPNNKLKGIKLIKGSNQ